MDGETNHAGPRGDDAVANQAADAFVDALSGNEPQYRKKWYDNKGVRSIKLGTIVAVLMTIGAIIKGCWDGDVTLPTFPVAGDAPNVENHDYSTFDQWHPTTVSAAEAQRAPLFWVGLPQTEPGENREWMIAEDGYWYFQRRRE